MIQMWTKLKQTLRRFADIKVRIIHKLQSFHAATVVVFYTTWKNYIMYFLKLDVVQSSLLNFDQINCPRLNHVTFKRVIFKSM